MTCEELAKKVRIHAIEMTHKSHSSHIAAILSVVDIVVYLYLEEMKTYPDDPKNPKRDRLILSKGHACPALYATLAELGFFPVSELDTYHQNGSILSGHISHKVPGVEFSTGSLGHGVCVAAGMAKAAKLNNQNFRVYAIVGDGECEEGSVWETALFAAHQKLDNFTVIVDHNKMQAMGRCDEQAGLTNLPDRWRIFGFHVSECDGHSFDSLREAFRDTAAGKPHCIIANTIKGKGVSFMENQLLWHYRDPQNEFYENALKELRGDE